MIKKNLRFTFSIRTILYSLCFLTLLIGQKGLLFAETGALVMLRGTCSSGKTAICEKIKGQKSHWHLIDLDEIYMNKVVDLVAATFPHEFAVVAQVIPPYNLYHVFKRDEIPLEGEVLEAHLKIQQSLNGTEGKPFQAALREELKKALIEEITVAFSEGKDVLMNTWLPRETIEEYFKEHQILNVLVYNPFPTSFQFLQTRNAEALRTGNLSGKRFLGQFFTSFHKFYRLTTEKSALSLSEHRRSDIDAVFDVAHDGVIQTREEQEKPFFTQIEMNVFDLERLRKAFIPSQTKDSESVFFEPKEQYDLVISTQNKDSKECAILLITKLDQILQP